MPFGARLQDHVRRLHSFIRSQRTGFSVKVQPLTLLFIAFGLYCKDIITDYHPASQVKKQTRTSRRRISARGSHLSCLVNQKRLELVCGACYDGITADGPVVGKGLSMNIQRQPAAANTAKITALYERLSREDILTGDSLSIQNQRDILENYAAQNGFTNIRHLSRFAREHVQAGVYLELFRQ
jgi:hypothetical protein